MRWIEGLELSKGLGKNFEFVDEALEIENDQLTATSPHSHPWDSNRSSKDGVTNSRGRLFLDYLACTNLSLLNGCTLGDIMGEFTSSITMGVALLTTLLPAAS